MSNDNGNGKASIVDLIENATRADLEDVQEKIDILRKKLASLECVKRILDTKFGTGRSSNKSNGDGTRGQMASNRQKAAKFLLHAGPTKSSLLASSIGVSPASIHHVLNCDLFERDINGIKLTAKGRTEAEKK